jgi:hypothetical protein
MSPPPPPTDQEGDDADRLTAQEEAGEEEDRAAEEQEDGGEEETSIATTSKPAAPPPNAAAAAPPPPRQQKPTIASVLLKPYRPQTRFLHPYYWLNPLATAALYAAFRAQWLGRAAEAMAAASSSPATSTSPLPYSRNLTKPSDLVGWERQVLYTFAVIALYKTFLKRRSWDGAVAHYFFYARLLVAVVLFYGDWRWLLLHVLVCWFGYAAVAQPTLDLDALASTRMRAAEKIREEKEEEEAEAAVVVAAAGSGAAKQQPPPPPPPPPSIPLGLSLPMHPPRLRELVLGEGEGGGSDENNNTATTANIVGSTKKAAKQLRQEQERKQKQMQAEAEAGWPAGSSSSVPSNANAADYWVLFIGCLSGGHHADSAAYAPAHDDLARRYGDKVVAALAEAAAAKEQAATTSSTTTKQPRNERPARLRFAHMDAALFAAFGASHPVLSLPPPQQLTWSRAVPCVLLIDGRQGKLLGRLPTKAQADDPFRRNLFTSADVARAFDLDGIVAGRAPTLPATAAAEEGGGGGGDKAKKAGGKSKDA